MAAVTFALLVACALVSLSPAPSGHRIPAAGAAGLHRSSGSVVSDVVSAQPVPCFALSSSPLQASVFLHAENCRSHDVASAVCPFGSECSRSVQSLIPASTACTSTRTAYIVAAHPSGLGSGVGQSGPATRGLLGPGVITPSHHDTKPTNGTTKNGSPTAHIVFTQAGIERRDAVASANLYKDVPSAFGDQVLSDPTVETTNTSITEVDNKVQLFFGNICSARVHQFTSSL
jgi:hypothetical protein